MDIRHLESDILFTSLPAEPQLGPELALLRCNVLGTQDKHLVLDLSRVEIITSPSIGGLLLLRRALSERGRRLILCNVHLATRCILRVVGLDCLFEVAADRFGALSALRESPEAQVDALHGSQGRSSPE